MNTTTLQIANSTTFEIAQEGTEYYSPDQEGGLFGTIYRQHWNITSFSGNTRDLDVSGVARIVKMKGFSQVGTTRRIPVPMTDETQLGNNANYRMRPYTLIDESVHKLFITRGGSVSSAKFFIDYTKLVDPGPHNIIFRAKDLMIRIDNGLRDIPPQSEVRYLAPDQYGNWFGEVRRMYFDLAGPYSHSAHTIRSDIHTLIASGGFYSSQGSTSGQMYPFNRHVLGGSTRGANLYNLIGSGAENLILYTGSSFGDTDARLNFWIDFIE